MDTTIVCGIDGSPDSEAALAVAARLAERLGARLVLAHVAEPSLTPHAYDAPFGGVPTADPVAAQEEWAARRQAAERLLEQVAASAGLGEVGQRVEIGLPAERLAEIADDEDAELIVVGSRGRGALKSAFLGSVSNSLVGVARCPVLVVPPGARGS